MVTALRLGGFNAFRERIEDRAAFSDVLSRRVPEIVFSDFFRFPVSADEDVPVYLQDLAIRSGVAWIGSSPDAMETALSKPRMKSLWNRSGVPTPEWFVVRKMPSGDIDGLQYLESVRDFPYIVKPASEGNSRGIDEGSVCRSSLDLFGRVRMIVDAYGEALVERFIAGEAESKEFTVALIGNGPASIIGAVEIRKTVPGSLVISESTKSNQQATTQPIEDPRLKMKVEQLARKVFAASGVRDYSRCDILLHKGGLYAIEINGQPMIPDPWFEACCAEAGLNATQYLQAIALAGIVGNVKTGHAFIPVPRELERVIPKHVFDRLVK